MFSILHRNKPLQLVMGLAIGFLFGFLWLERTGL